MHVKLHRTMHMAATDLRPKCRIPLVQIMTSDSDSDAILMYVMLRMKTDIGYVQLKCLILHNVILLIR